MSLLVVIPCTARDFVSNKDRLFKSINNFASSFERVSFYFVIQGVSHEILAQFKCIDRLGLNCTTKLVNWSGVSKARNMGIAYARNKKYTHLIFHDVSLFFPLATCEYFSSNLEKTSSVKVKHLFSDGFALNDKVNDFEEIKFNPIYDCYIWCWMFSLSDIKVMFNEAIGPGDCTFFKSGEDVQFLFDNFFIMYQKQLKQPRGLYVYHPTRSSSFDKHLLYARGQGKLFRNLLFKYPSSPRIWLDTILFLGNGLYRLLLCKENSLLIFKERLKGLFL